MTITERQTWLLDASPLTAEDLAAWTPEAGLNLEIAEQLIENAAGVYSLPLAVAQHFVVNGSAVLVPMAVEEPSVVAGVSFMAKLAQAGGGFRAAADPPEMIGQIQLLDIRDLDGTTDKILAHKQDLLDSLQGLHPTIENRGGGARDLEVRRISESPIGPFLVVHLIYDVQDVMGANAVNTACEYLALKLEALTGCRSHLRILSNLADRRLARARVVIPSRELAFADFSGERVRDGIVEAWAFAAADPYRAATHNKGIMNGVDAVVLATGNDWRGVEAGAHAYAARSGRYTALSTWSVDAEGNLVGELEMPLAVGIVGGSTQALPAAKTSLKLLGCKTAGELAEIIVSVGLAQNLAALRALATEGIQHGHMRLHARQVALAAGANAQQVEALADQLVREKNVKMDRARQILDGWSKQTNE